MHEASSCAPPGMHEASSWARPLEVCTTARGLSRYHPRTLTHSPPSFFDGEPRKRKPALVSFFLPCRLRHTRPEQSSIAYPLARPSWGPQRPRGEERAGSRRLSSERHRRLRRRRAEQRRHRASPRGSFALLFLQRKSPVAPTWTSRISTSSDTVGGCGTWAR